MLWEVYQEDNTSKGKQNDIFYIYKKAYMLNIDNHVKQLIKEEVAKAMEKVNKIGHIVGQNCFIYIYTALHKYK